MNVYIKHICSYLFSTFCLWQCCLILYVIRELCIWIYKRLACLLMLGFIVIEFCWFWLVSVSLLTQPVYGIFFNSLEALKPSECLLVAALHIKLIKRGPTSATIISDLLNQTEKKERKFCLYFIFGGLFEKKTFDVFDNALSSNLIRARFCIVGRFSTFLWLIFFLFTEWVN